jgi:hypothetical protein
MSNDTGSSGSSPDDRPPHTSVRHLHEDEPTGSTATDEWYETERLTEHITGGGRSTSAVDEWAVAHESTVVLDWRHADPSPAPNPARRPRLSLRAPAWIQARVGSLASRHLVSPAQANGEYAEFPERLVACRAWAERADGRAFSSRAGEAAGSWAAARPRAATARHCEVATCGTG